MEQMIPIQEVLIWVLPVLFAVTAHEAAHGYVAYLFGDRTASVLGRLTFNPIKHIDIFGTIVVPVSLLLIHSGVIFGWAKPVPVNSNNFNNPRLNTGLVALAGPVSNFAMAIVWAAIAKIGFILLKMKFSWAFAIYAMGSAGVSINLMLFVFNLLPLPPLDGGHIMICLLPRKVGFYFERIIPYGFFILLLFIAFGVINGIVSPAVSFLYSLINIIFNLSL